jgi:hypothetical protein
MDNVNGLLDSGALQKDSRTKRWRRHLQQDVDESWADVILLVFCLLAGIVDSAVFNVWSCFVSMQTGKDGELTYAQVLTSIRQYRVCWARGVTSATQSALSMGQIRHSNSVFLHRELRL